jgi:SAM-dependent methyltransferase
MDGFEAFRAAVAECAAGRPREAAARLSALAGERALYAHAARWLGACAPGVARPYARAEGFAAYRQAPSARRGKVVAARALSERLASVPTRSLVDLGCGDGEVLDLALESASDAPALTLVEPSQELLAIAAERLAHFAPRTLRASAQALAVTEGDAGSWDLVVATWSLQNLTAAERAPVLVWLRARTGALLLAEFDADVPGGEPGCEERARFYHERYLAGVDELEGLAPKVADDAAQAFLMPILFGALSERASPNHEQSIEAWSGELERAGFENVSEAARAPHWWSEACVLLAT